MKSVVCYLQPIAILVFAILLFSSCQDGEDELAAVMGVADLQSVDYVADYTEEPLLIAENQPIELAYRIMPANMARVLASRTSIMLWMAPRVPTTAHLDITNATATEDGLLTLTVVPSGTEIGHTYVFALKISDSFQSLLTTDIKFSREPLPVPSVRMNTNKISQTMAE